MGVMECERTGCRNIWCKRLILGNMYICAECFAELKKLKDTWPEEMSEQDMLDQIQRFMESPGSIRLLSGNKRDEVFKRLVAD